VFVVVFELILLLLVRGDCLRGLNGYINPSRQKRGGGGSAQHISSFRSGFERVPYEPGRQIIYVFILFSHNFIINVYHHYCSSFILHSSSCCQMKNSSSLPNSRVFRFSLRKFFFSFSPPKNKRRARERRAEYKFGSCEAQHQHKAHKVLLFSSRFSHFKKG
jgi:hypothetical protein